PAPGSIIAYDLTTPGGEYLPMVLGVLIAKAVSFAVSALILKFTGQPEGDLSAATAQMEEQKGRKYSVAGSLTAEDSEAQKALERESTKAASSIDHANVDKFAFECDAGMGSRAMGEGRLKNKFKKQVSTLMSQTRPSTS